MTNMRAASIYEANTTKLDKPPINLIHYTIMKQNGRATHFIQSTSGARSRLWERLFGTAVLPVLAARPRLQEVKGAGTVLAYDLDLNALHSFSRSRLAAHIARRSGVPYDVVNAELVWATSWPITADGCIVVETAAPEGERPSFLYWLNGYSLLASHNG